MPAIFISMDSSTYRQFLKYFSQTPDLFTIPDRFTFCVSAIHFVFAHGHNIYESKVRVVIKERRQLRLKFFEFIGITEQHGMDVKGP